MTNLAGLNPDTLDFLHMHSQFRGVTIEDHEVIDGLVDKRLVSNCQWKLKTLHLNGYGTTHRISEFNLLLLSERFPNLDSLGLASAKNLSDGILQNTIGSSNTLVELSIDSLILLTLL